MLRCRCNNSQSENRLVKMTRKDLSNNILEVEHTDGTERWLVVKTTLYPKKVHFLHYLNLRNISYYFINKCIDFGVCMCPF